MAAHSDGGYALAIGFCAVTCFLWNRILKGRPKISLDEMEKILVCVIAIALSVVAIWMSFP